MVLDPRKSSACCLWPCGGKRSITTKGDRLRAGPGGGAARAAAAQRVIAAGLLHPLVELLRSNVAVLEAAGAAAELAASGDQCRMQLIDAGFLPVCPPLSFQVLRFSPIPLPPPSGAIVMCTLGFGCLPVARVIIQCKMLAAQRSIQKKVC